MTVYTIWLLTRAPDWERHLSGSGAACRRMEALPERLMLETPPQLVVWDTRLGPAPTLPPGYPLVEVSDEAAFAALCEHQLPLWMARHEIAQLRELAKRQQLENESLRQEKAYVESQIEQTERVLLASYEDLRRKNADLGIRNERLSEANRFLNDFLANLSHELRTPLTLVLAWTTTLEDMLAAGTLSEDLLRQGLPVIDKGANSLNHLIEELLDLARLQAGKIEIHNQLTDIAPLVEASVQLCDAQAQAKNLSLSVEIESPPLMAKCDERRLRQCLINLISNAFKFTPEGGTVTVRALREHGQIKIAVSDTGIGIASELLPTIFDRFRQGDSSSTRRFGGLGIGLSLVQELMALQGGRVTVKSEEGTGSTFMLTLPDPALAKTFARALAVVPSGERGERLRAILEPADIELMAFIDAEEALRVAGTRKPDVVLVDLSAPSFGGYRWIQALRRKQGLEAVPVIGFRAEAACPGERLMAALQDVLPESSGPDELLRALAHIGADQTHQNITV